MHYWIIYVPGAGGHGFANLLEHADNITPADLRDEWRIHFRPGRYDIYDRPIKFYPAWDNRDQELLERAKSKDIHTVLVAHPTDNIYPTLLGVSHNILIHLYSSDSIRVVRDLNAKVQLNMPMTHANNIKAQTEELKTQQHFAAHIDIVKVQKDWNYLDTKLQDLGIKLNKTYYDQYMTYIDL